MNLIQYITTKYDCDDYDSYNEYITSEIKIINNEDEMCLSLLNRLHSTNDDFNKKINLIIFDGIVIQSTCEEEHTLLSYISNTCDEYPKNSDDLGIPNPLEYYKRGKLKGKIFTPSYYNYVDNGRKEEADNAFKKFKLIVDKARKEYEKILYKKEQELLEKKRLEREERKLKRNLKKQEEIEALKKLIKKYPNVILN